MGGFFLIFPHFLVFMYALSSTEEVILLKKLNDSYNPSIFVASYIHNKYV